MTQGGDAVQFLRRRSCAFKFFNGCRPQCALDPGLDNALLSGLQCRVGLRGQCYRLRYDDFRSDDDRYLGDLLHRTAAQKRCEQTAPQETLSQAGAANRTDRGIFQKQFNCQRVSLKTSTYFAKVAVNGAEINKNCAIPHTLPMECRHV